MLKLENMKGMITQRFTAPLFSVLFARLFISTDTNQPKVQALRHTEPHILSGSIRTSPLFKILCSQDDEITGYLKNSKVK